MLPFYLPTYLQSIKCDLNGKWRSSLALLFAFYASNEGTDPMVHCFSATLDLKSSSSWPRIAKVLLPCPWLLPLGWLGASRLLHCSAAP